MKTMTKRVLGTSLIFLVLAALSLTLIQIGRAHV